MKMMSIEDLIEEMYDTLNVCDEIERKLKHIQEMLDDKLYDLEVQEDGI